MAFYTQTPCINFFITHVYLAIKIVNNSIYATALWPFYNGKTKDIRYKINKLKLIGGFPQVIHKAAPGTLAAVGLRAAADRLALPAMVDQTKKIML
jgi:hypothetical protein